MERLLPLPSPQADRLQALSTIMLAQGSENNSKWAPYFAILPRNLDSLVFWSDSELSELQASTVVKKIGRDKAEEMFLKHIAPLKIKNASIEMCHRVSSIIMAYAFDIPEKSKADDQEPTGDDDEDELVSDDEDEEITALSMIPLADMLNADGSRNNVRLCCDNEDLEMRTIKPIGKGDEIFNDYGELPRADLLRRYGYVTDNYACYDVAEIWTEPLLSLLRNNGLPSVGLEPLSQVELKKRVSSSPTYTTLHSFVYSNHLLG
jgi:SET domain-containing protein 6